MTSWAADQRSAEPVGTVGVFQYALFDHKSLSIGLKMYKSLTTTPIMTSPYSKYISAGITGKTLVPTQHP